MGSICNLSRCCRLTWSHKARRFTTQAGYVVYYAISFYDARARKESPRSAWWGPKTDPKKLYGGFGLIKIPVDPTGQATARRIWRKFEGEPQRMIHELPDNTTTKYQDDVLG